MGFALDMYKHSICSAEQEGFYIIWNRGAIYRICESKYIERCKPHIDKKYPTHLWLGGKTPSQPVCFSAEERYGKIREQGKTRKLKILGIGKFLLDGLIILVGVVVIALLGLRDNPHTTRDDYGVGVFVIFLVFEAGSVIHRAIRKRKEKKPSPGGKVAERSEVG